MTSQTQVDERLSRALSDAAHYRDRQADAGDGAVSTDRNSLVAVAEAYETLRSANVRLASELAAKQARIDALMLEHCPEEMSEAQKADWAKHQVAVSAQDL